MEEQLDFDTQYGFARASWPLGLLVKARRINSEWRARLYADADTILRTHRDIVPEARAYYAASDVIFPNGNALADDGNGDAAAAAAYDWLLLAGTALGSGRFIERSWRIGRLFLTRDGRLDSEQFEFLKILASVHRSPSAIPWEEGAGDSADTPLPAALIEALLSERFPRATPLIIASVYHDPVEEPLYLGKKGLTLRDIYELVLFLSGKIRGLDAKAWALALTADEPLDIKEPEALFTPFQGDPGHTLGMCKWIAAWLTRDLGAITPALLAGIFRAHRGWLRLLFERDFVYNPTMEGTGPDILRVWLNSSPSAFTLLPMNSPVLFEWLRATLPPLFTFLTTLRGGVPPNRALLATIFAAYLARTGNSAAIKTLRAWLPASWLEVEGFWPRLVEAIKDVARVVTPQVAEEEEAAGH